MTSTAVAKAQSYRRHWIVAVGAMICMIAGSVPLSGVSFMNAYIFRKMGPGTASNTPQAQILLYITLIMVSIVASMMTMGGVLLPKLGTRKLMLIGSIVVAGALMIMWSAQTPTMLYVGSVVLGLGYGVSYQLVPIVWVNNWFVAKKGLVVGLVTGGTGIGGIIWSYSIPIIGGNPASPDFNVDAYRTGYLVMAAVVLGLTIPASLFLAVERPSMLGLTPFGAAEAGAAVRSVTDVTKPVPGFTFQQAMRSVWLWTIFASSLLLGIVHAATQVVLPYLSAQWTTSVEGGGMAQKVTMFSLATMIWTVGLIILKPALGFLNDKLGVLIAMTIALGMQGAFFLFLPYYASAGNQYGFWLPVVAMIFMSAGMSTGTVQPPLLTATAMGQKAFGKIWSIVGSAWILGQALGAPIWGLFYVPKTATSTITYAGGFRLAPIALALVVVLGVIGMNRGKAQHMKLYQRELAEWEKTQVKA